MTTSKFRMVLAIMLTSFYCLVSAIIILYPILGPLTFDQPNVLNNYRSYLQIVAGSA